MIKRFLRGVNALPIEVTVRHYQPFEGEALISSRENSEGAWDRLRKENQHFSVSDNREEWLKAAEGKQRKDGQDSQLVNRAKDVLSLIEKENFKSIFSVGVGGAGLEYQLKKINPRLKIVCSEYSDFNVERLKKVFTEANEIIFFDITKSDWKEIKTDLVLMYRVDPHFTNKEWGEIFENMNKAGIKNILFIPSNRLTLISLIKSWAREISWKLKNKKTTCVGYQRTDKVFRSCWKDFYADTEYRFGGMKGFYLKILNFKLKIP